MDDSWGYLLVHFVEDSASHAEKVYFTLSRGNDPLRWFRLNGSQPVLESTRETTGVRDPFIVRRRDGAGFHILATDLRVWGEDAPDWDAFTRHGSRKLVIWDSPDLVTWSAPRYVSVAPATFGMAWAPTVTWDEATGDYLVFFSGTVYAEHDADHASTSEAAVHVTRTRDFRTFTDPELYLSMPTGVIDLVVVPDGGTVHVLAKHDDRDPETLAVFHQVRTSIFDPMPVTVATHIGAQFGDHVEGPLLFKEPGTNRWYCWVDRYGRSAQGFQALTSTDPASGQWKAVTAGDFHIPLATKHGSVLPLARSEWEALQSRFGPAAE